MRAACRLGIVVVVSMAPAVARAQFDVNPGVRSSSRMPGRLQVSGFVGGMSLDHTLGASSNLYQSVNGVAADVDFGKLYGFRASWGFTPNLAAEFTASTSSNGYTFDVVDDVELGTVALGEQFRSDQLYLGGNVVYHFTTGNFVPYATGGIGLARTTPQEVISGIDRVSALDFNVGGGVKLWLSSPNWLGVRVDVRYHSANDGLAFPQGASNPKGLEFSAGASFRWF